MAARIRVRAQILGCRGCGLRESCSNPVPFSGHNPSPIVVVGEAPGQDEDARGEPFVGPAGRLLRAELDRVMGMEGWHKTIAYANTVCCFPHRTPTAQEVASCQTNLRDQLTLLEPSYVLVVGGVALSAFWPRLRIGEMAGRWWSESWMRGEEGGKKSWLFATVHPSAVLRAGGATSKIGRQFRGDLEVWASVVADAKRPGLEVDCVKCGRGDRLGRAEVWDRNIGACRKHATQAGMGGEGGGGTGGVSTAARRRAGGPSKANPSVTSPRGRGQSAIPGSLFG